MLLPLLLLLPPLLLPQVLLLGAIAGVSQCRQPAALLLLLVC